MRLSGCVMLLFGFFIVVTALVLLPSFQLRLAFIAAGIGVEVLGLGLLIQGHKPVEKEQG